MNRRAYREGDDLKLKLSVTKAGVAVNPLLVPFELLIWTDSPQDGVRCGWTGSAFYGGASSRNGFIIVSIDTPGFVSGLLNMEVTMKYPDSEMPDRVRLETKRVLLEAMPRVENTESVEWDALISHEVVGRDVYSIAVAHGFVGTEEEYLASLKGPKGDTGAQGAAGGTGATGPKGDKGDTGDTGATGPKGEKGDTGEQGEKGEKGDTGIGAVPNYQNVATLPSSLVDNTIYTITSDVADDLIVPQPAASVLGIVVRFATADELTSGAQIGFAAGSTIKWYGYKPDTAFNASTEYELTILDGIYTFSPIATNE